MATKKQEVLESHISCRSTRITYLRASKSSSRMLFEKKGVQLVAGNFEAVIFSTIKHHCPYFSDSIGETQDLSNSSQTFRFWLPCFIHLHLHIFLAMETIELELTACTEFPVSPSPEATTWSNPLCFSDIF